MAQNASHPAPGGRTLLERDSELSAIERSLTLLCGARDAVADPVADPVDPVDPVDLGNSVDPVDLGGARAARAARTGGVLAFAGTAGAGKTALLGETGARAIARGCTVLRARGGEQEQECAFHVVRQLVQPLFATADENAHRELLGGWYDILAPAAGLIASAAPGMPGASTTPGAFRTPDPQGVRDGFDWLLTRFALPHAPLVLLIDDAHWADSASLAWLAGFVPRAAALPTLIVTGYRAEELPTEAAGFRRAVEDQDEREGEQPHELAPLSAHAVASLVKERLGDDADTAFCQECWTVTGGSPFEITELVARSREGGLKPQQHDVPRLRELALASKGDGFLDRLQSLGPTRVRLGWAVAVLGTGATLRLAAAVAALGPGEARHAAAGLRAARVLSAPEADGAHRTDTAPPTAAGSGVGWGPDAGGELLEFCHPSLATAVYRAIPDSLRTALHGQAAASVAAMGSGPTASARHLLEIHPDGDPAVVAELRQAAREYLGAGAPEAAHRCLGRALREPPTLAERPRVLYELGSSALLHAPAATVNHLRAALEEPELDPALRVLVVCRLAQALGHTGRIGEAARTVELEARRATDTRTRLRMRAELFRWNAFRADEEDSPARSRRLARLVGRLGARGMAGRYLLGLRAWDAMVRGEPRATALAHAEEALGDGLSWTDEEWGFEVPVLVALTFLYCDRPGRAEELFRRGIAECEREGWRGAHLSTGLTLLGYIRYRRGRLSDAGELVRAGLRIADRVGGLDPARWFAPGILIEVLIARGEVDEGERTAARYSCGQVTPHTVVCPDPQTVYAELLLARGLREEAGARLAAVGERLEPRRMRNPAWCPWQLRLAEALSATDQASAARTARAAVERARRFGAPSALGQALHISALVSTGAARLERLREAVAHLERSPASYELASAVVSLGAELRGAGLPQDAADSLYRGLAGATRCGALPLAARARGELAAAGLPPLRPLLQSPHPPLLRDDGTETLTATERTAALWVARGTRVADTAHEMDLSEADVRLLLSGVCRKLGTDVGGLPGPLGRRERHDPGASAVGGD